MKLTKKQVDMIIEEIQQERQQYALNGNGDNGIELIEYLIAIGYAKQISTGIERHIHKRLLEFLELPEYWTITKRIAKEIDEYNKAKAL